MAAPRATPLRSALRSRLQRWALRRQGRDVLPTRLAARRVYILPTPAGWTFAMLLAVMFLAGMNYGNGLALLFTFWLTGFALVAMVQTQRGLTGTQLEAASAEAAHAGGAVRLQITHRSRLAPADIELAAEVAGEPVSGTGTAMPDGRGRLVLDLPVQRRGRWHAPSLRITSSAPFGLFRAWSWLDLDVTTVVYPRAEGARRLPETGGASAGGMRRLHGQDELAWLRDFREGDSPRQVAWKAYARGQPLLVREYHGEGAPQHEFDFETLAGLPVEVRLSQLTRWVVDAAAEGRQWVLRLPGSPPLAGGGATHRSQCLTRLALFGAGEP